MTTPIRAPLRRTTAGFTLIELMVTVTVVAVTLLIAVPKLTRAIQGSKVQRTMSAVVADLNNARMLAIRKGKSASIIVTSDGRGYNMVVGTDTMRRYRLNTQETNITITPFNQTITFNSRGMITAGGGTTGTWLRAIHGTDSASVWVSGIGRVYRAY